MGRINSLERIPQTIEQFKEKNATLAKDIPQLKEIAGKQWKKEDELKGLKSELAALDRKIQLELAKDNEPQQQQAVAKLDYRWFVTFDNYLRKKRTNNLLKSTEIERFLLLFNFFCYLCNDFPHSLLDDCRFKRLFENKTAHAVLREAKSSDGVERGGLHRKSRKAIPPEVGSGKWHRTDERAIAQPMKCKKGPI